MSKNTLIVFLIGLAIIGSCVFVSGCTSAQNNQGTVQDTRTVTATPLPTAVSTTAPATTPVTSAQVTVQTTVITTTATPTPAVVSVTLNSAVKQAKLGSFTQKVSGRTFLVLDLTIKNNDANEDFEYTNASFALVDKTATPHTLSPLTTIVTGSLENPFTSGMVPVKSEKTGQLVFSVNENSGLYKFMLYDPQGNAITSIDNITVA